MQQFQSYQKKILLAYAIVIGLLLVCAIYLSVTIQMFERSGWDAFIFKQTGVYIVPISLGITMLLMHKIKLNDYNETNDSNAKKGKALLFIIALIINGMLLLAAAHLAAKIYNIHGAKQEQTIIEGKITAVYNNRSIKSKNRRKKQITVFDINQLRAIKFKVKKKFEVNTYFKDTLTKGSLGFLYQLH